MKRDGDLQLNVSCSHNEPDRAPRKLPDRMPDGSKIESRPNLIKKINKTHVPATKSGTVFIPKHKLPVLDEFGLFCKSDKPEPSSRPIESKREHEHKPKTSEKLLQQVNEGTSSDATKSKSSIEQKPARRKRKKKVDEPMIIPKEVQAVAGGLPPSFPKHRIKKFTEEYHIKKRKLQESGEGLGDEIKKKRKSFVPGLNPRKKEKSKAIFTDMKLQDLEDLHPYLIQNLEQNFDIKNLTKIQSIAMPELLQTRYASKERQFLINSGVGSGKILSYVVPIINNLALLEPKIDRMAGIYALILLPTRELAADVNQIMLKLCKSFQWIVPGLLVGGERKKSEKARLRKGLNILITTPGRLIDHMEHSQNLDLSKLKFCVLADAHKLIDPERVEVGKRIAILLRKRLPRDCVKCVVTATLTKKLEKFHEILVPHPKQIDAFKEFE